jgi:acyl carrier protein
MSMTTLPPVDLGNERSTGLVPLIERLRVLPRALRFDALMTFLRTHIAERLHLELSDLQPRTQLMALGMSSLQSVEVKMFLENELRTELPSSLVFDYPTLAVLVPRILELSGLSDASPAGSVPTELGASGDRGVRSVADELAKELDELRRQGAL